MGNSNYFLGIIWKVQKAGAEQFSGYSTTTIDKEPKIQKRHT